MDEKPNISSLPAPLADALLSIPAGRVRCVFGATFAEASAALDEADPGAHAPLVLLIRATLGQDSGALVDVVIRVLAEMALSMWPGWWSDFDLGLVDTFDLRTAQLRVQTSNLPNGVTRPWAKRAIACASTGRLPLPEGMPREIQLQQLSLAIHSGSLVIGLVVDNETILGARLTALVHAAEWIARNADLGVALLLATSLREQDAVQRVLYGAHAIPPIVARLRSKDEQSLEVEQLDNDLRKDAPHVWLGPILGRPHPNSPGELKLYKAIQADRELAPLFTFNVRVDTLFGTRPMVDLLCANGRVVVEVDSYLYHCDEAAFASDRTRDYHLLVSGYLVLRLVYGDIMTDVQLALAKIRRVLALRRTTGARG